MPITLLGSADARITYGDVSQLGGITTGLTVAIDVVITGGLVTNNRLCGQWGATFADCAFMFAIIDTDELLFLTYGPSQLYGIKTVGLNLTPGTYKICGQYDCTIQQGKIFVNGAAKATIPEYGGSPAIINNSTTAVYIGNDGLGNDGVDGTYANFALWGQVLSDAVCIAITDGTTDRATLQSSTGILYAPLTKIGSTSDQWNGYTGVAFLGMTLRFVNTGSTSGGTGLTNATTGTDRAYASLAEAVGGLPTTITAIGNPWKIICSGATADTTGVTLPGACTTSTTRWLEIVAADTDWAMGFWDTTKYRLDVSGASGLQVNIDHLVVRGLQVKTTTITGTLACIRTGDSSGNPSPFTDVYQCFLQLASSGDFGSGACGFGVDGYVQRRVRFINCVGINAYNTNYPSVQTWAFRMSYVRSGSGFFNCTAYNSNVGFLVDPAYPAIVTNCLSFNKALNASFIADFNGTPASGSSNNLSNDGTAVGTSPIINQSAANVAFLSTTPTHPNFLDLDVGSSALTSGATDPLVGLYLDDIRQRVRSVPWSIGAAEPGVALVLETARPSATVASGSWTPVGV